MSRILDHLYGPVSDFNQARPCDLLVWRNQAGDVVHSAVFTHVPDGAASLADFVAGARLQSKNGAHPEVNMPGSVLMYGTGTPELYGLPTRWVPYGPTSGEYTTVNGIYRLNGT